MGEPRVAYVIRLVELRGIPGPLASPDVPEGAYLRSYSPDAHDGQGDVVWTTDMRLAVQFSSAGGAMRFYRQQSTVRPLRDDNRPNRPLTAATVEIIVVPWGGAIDFSGCSRTDRNNLRAAYRELRHYGHDRLMARSWVAERLGELA